MRIDGYYNKESIDLSDNPEEATFSFAHATIPENAKDKLIDIMCDTQYTL